MKKTLLLLSLLLTLGTTAQAQKVLHLGRYAQANAALEAPEGARVVLYGDSITDGWASQRPEFFQQTGFIGRGISGEVTAQMLLRFRADVLDIGASTFVLLAGINDIAMNLGDTYDEDATFANIQSMVELALHNNVRPVICSLLPSYKLGWRPEVTDTFEKVIKLNLLPPPRHHLRGLHHRPRRPRRPHPARILRRHRPPQRRRLRGHGKAPAGESQIILRPALQGTWADT